jgi:hypothetical protein
MATLIDELGDADLDANLSNPASCSPDFREFGGLLIEFDPERYWGGLI